MYGYSQSVNDYGIVIIPVKYDFVRHENAYRLNTLTKINLKKAGFEAFYTNETIPTQYSNRCSLLYVDVKEETGFLVTKLFIEFKDCTDKVIFKSEVGKSRAKNYEIAYREALEDAFKSVYALQYKYNGYNGEVKVNSQNATIMVPILENSGNSLDEAKSFFLFAQPIKNGFQLIDSTSKVIMKIYNTTNPSIYLATKESIQGIMVLKNGYWFFEYYQNDTLMSEETKIKF